MKTTTRLSILLLMAVLCIITLASAQDVTSISTLAARHYETGEPLSNFIKISFPQDLRRRALNAFSKIEVGDVFYNVDGGSAEQEIVRKYYDLSALPIKERRALFRRAAPAEKSGLWRTHLTVYLVKHPELNTWQQEIVRNAMLLLTPEYFDVPLTSPDWKTKVREPSRLLERQIAVAFPVEDAAKIFATLGDDTQAAKLGPTAAGFVSLRSINYKPALSDSLPYQQWTHSRFSTQDVDLEQNNSCQCSMESDFCPIWTYCQQSTCNPQSGCGFAWSHPCNGACR